MSVKEKDYDTPRACGICEESRAAALHDPVMKWVCGECQEAFWNMKMLLREMAALFPS